VSDRNLIITLDGPAGCGKSTASIRLAHHFSIPFVDTGAMYRTVAYESLHRKIDLDDEEKVKEVARSLLFQFSFEDNEARIIMRTAGHKPRRLGQEIRSPEVSAAASKVARHKGVREVLVLQQQKIGQERGGVIEGRDAGTVIFPDAPVKFFLTASPEERAKRRFKELKRLSGGPKADFAQVLQEGKGRDAQDEGREHSPLKAAKGAIIVDTTDMNLDQVVEHLIQEVKKVQNL